MNFSLINNSEETTSFFNKLVNYINLPNNMITDVFIDIYETTELTIDALMYLLAIMMNLKSKHLKKYRFHGNSPKEENVKKLLTDSGFYRFVNYHGNEPLSQSNNTIQIVSGEKCQTELAKRLSDFVAEKANVSFISCRFLYEICIELMSNSHKHAYFRKKNNAYPRWYCFAEYDEENRISFTFVDTGSGIPSTVKKNFAETIDFLKLKGNHKYVVSALNGDFRTSTKKYNRGKGLPKIKEISATHKINNLHIITNKADVKVCGEETTSYDMNHSLMGTLYYWEIDLNTLKEEFYAN